MKIKLANYLTLFIFLFVGSRSLAQDHLYLLDGTIKKVKIDTIILDTIYYYNSDFAKYVRRKHIIYQVDRIIFENGEKISFTDSYKNPKLYTAHRKRALKLHILSTNYGHTHLSYEKNITPGRAIEYSIGIIGLGKNKDLVFSQGDSKANALGMHIGLGYKIYRKPGRGKLGFRKYKNFFSEWYIMPKIHYGSYRKTYIISSGGFSPSPSVLETREKIRFGALLLYIGYQDVFKEWFLFDFNVGFGFGHDNMKKKFSVLREYEYNRNHYVVSINENILAVSGGVRIGFAF